MRLSTFKEDIDHRDIVMSKILIIEDDTDIADLISIHMNDNGHEATKVHDGGQGIQSAHLPTIKRRNIHN